MSKPGVIETAAGPARLLRSVRRKTLAITVHPDGALELVAPAGAALEAILKRVARRTAWIARQRRSFAAMNAVRPGRRHVSGATHRYLGRQYLLKVEQGTPARVVLRGAHLKVQVPEPTEEAVGRALRAWYRRHALAQLTRRVEAWREWCAARRLPAPVLKLHAMAKRWGSAHRDGTIWLNPELIKAPSICIDYVIAHEIAHLRHPDHGPRFHALLSELCPGWKGIKARLEAFEL